MEIEAQFQVEREKILNFEVSQIFWSNKMDLLAIITKNNTLEIHRISFTTTKIFSIEESNLITSGQFSPDSQYLLYTCQNGQINAIKTENGEKIFEVNKKFSSALTFFNISWAPFVKLQKFSKLYYPLNKKNQLNKLLTLVSPHLHSDKKNLNRLQYLQNLQNDFSLAVISDINGQILINLNGILPLCLIDINKAVRQFPQFNNDSFKIITTFLSQKSSQLNVLLEMDQGNIHQKFNLLKVDMKSHFFDQSKEEIVNLMITLSIVDENLAFMNKSFESLYTQVKDIIKNFSNKIYILQKCIDDIGLNKSAHDELLKYLKAGICSPAITTFFQKELFDTKILSKADDIMKVYFQNIHELIMESILNVIERVIALIGKLQNYAKSQQEYCSLGLNQDLLEQLLSRLNEINLLLQEYQEVIIDSKLNIRNFFVWLNKSTIKSCPEQDTEIENLKSVLNKYTPDIERLHFFLDNSGMFNLTNLSSYFSLAEEDLAFFCSQPQLRFTDLFKENKYSDKKSEQSKIENKMLLEISEQDHSFQGKLNSFIKASYENQFMDLFSDDEKENNNKDSLNYEKCQYDGLFKKENQERKNFAQLREEINSIWLEIMKQPFENISNSFQLKNIINFGQFVNNPNMVIHTPIVSFLLLLLDSALDTLRITTFTEEKSKDDNKVSILSQTPKNISPSEQTILTISQYVAPIGYEIKELHFSKINEILALLQMKIPQSTDKQQQLFQNIEQNIRLDRVIATQIQQNQRSLIASILISPHENNDYQKEFRQSDIVNAADFQKSVSQKQISLSKALKLESLNVQKLRASLKGLISLISGENKLMILMQNCN